MSWEVYLKLSVMMFLEYAIWGAWTPVLASHLIGTLKLSGRQTGWIYATLWLGIIVASFIGGQITDRWIATEYYLAAVHLVGGIVLLVAAGKTKFRGLLGLMGLYALLYAPTVALVNSMTFRHLTEPDAQAGRIRVWGTIGWIVAGLTLAFWRRFEKLKIRGSDALTLAGVFSFIMGIFCFILPHTPPSETPGHALAIVDAFKMLSDINFLVFLVISFIVTTELQFYYIPMAPFLEDIGIKHRNVSAVMTLAQCAEIIAMFWLLKLSMSHLGLRWTLAIGVIAWPVRYMIFAMMRPVWLVISSLTIHGFCYTFFFFAGQLYVDKIAPPDIRSSAQALILVVTLGFGNFIGTQITGVVMDFFKRDGKFRWRPIFLFPCVLTIICAVAFVLFFKD